MPVLPPDSEVAAKPKRRVFTAEYKLRILQEAELAAGTAGGVGALLRREGLYSSHLVCWRRERQARSLQALAPRKRGRKSERDPLTEENEKLRRQVGQLTEKLRKAEIIIDVQKKVAALLGRPIAEPEENFLMAAVGELATTAGIYAACQALALPRASYYRHRRPRSSASPVSRRRPARALHQQEKETVLACLHEERFQDRSPAAVYATLLDEGTYHCSISTMYRVLDEHSESRERRDQLTHPPYQKPELLATAPNQLWSWDITKLLGPAKWTYFYLYVILDVFSRYVTGWMVAMRESAELAKRLIEQSCAKQDIARGQLTLHADRGSSMSSKPVAFLLADLGVTRTHSRPHVSNDNPYSESQFRTLKYRPEFPDRFGCIQDSRAFSQGFFRWYNQEHRHSGLGLLTPAMVHYHQTARILEQRQAVLDAAYRVHPERFVRQAPKPPAVPTEAWINKPAQLT
ncbi:MAG TPA: IS3 family transposase [Candidatus Acidoferrum sp.]|nr:IS3 family transposase [Candidatus Acidoferrum sp.]